MSTGYLQLDGVRGVTNQRRLAGGLSFDGATTGAKVTHTIASIGTIDFTLRTKIRVPTATPATRMGLAYIGTSLTTYLAARGFMLFLNTSGGISAVIVGATTADLRTAASTGLDLITAYGGKQVDIAVTRDGDALAIYLNGVAVSFDETTAGDGPFWSDTITSTYLIVGQGTTTTLFNSSIYNVDFFNRTLTAAELLYLVDNDFIESEKWGTLTGTTSGTITTGKRYRITTFVAGDVFTNVGAASNATGVEFIATGATPTTWTNGSTVNQIGALMSADMTIGVGVQIPDRSSNNFHGRISATGTAHTVAQSIARAIYTIAADGYLGGSDTACVPATAIITSITAYAAGTPTLTVGDDAGADDNVVASVALSAGLNDLTLLKRTLTTGVDGRVAVDFAAAGEAVTFTIYYFVPASY